MAVTSKNWVHSSPKFTVHAEVTNIKTGDYKVTVKSKFTGSSHYGYEFKLYVVVLLNSFGIGSPKSTLLRLEKTVPLFFAIKYACLLPFNLPMTTIPTSDIYNIRHLLNSSLHSPYTNT